MKELFAKWYITYLSHPQQVILGFLLIINAAVIVVMGDLLAPVIASVVIAFLLDSIVKVLERFKLPRLFVVILVFVLFVGLMVLSFLIFLPLLWGQVSQFAQDLPGYLEKGHAALMHLPDQYPQFISVEQVDEIMRSLTTRVGSLGQTAVANSFTTVMGLLSVLVILILVPFMVFFMLKDKALLVAWFAARMPDDSTLAHAVWTDMEVQIGNYVRGKVLEIMIVWLVSYILFSALGLRYALVLAMLVGFSVVVPYVGAAAATLPIAVVAFAQWGVSPQFGYVIAAYAVLQAIDGNVLAPLVLSEAVNLHPVAIIVAILVFGGFWGIWGVFFAIPLATLVQTVLRNWPKVVVDSAEPI